MESMNLLWLEDVLLQFVHQNVNSQCSSIAQYILQEVFGPQAWSFWEWVRACCGFSVIFPLNIHELET